MGLLNLIVILCMYISQRSICTCSYVYLPFTRRKGSFKLHKRHKSIALTLWTLDTLPPGYSLQYIHFAVTAHDLVSDENACMFLLVTFRRAVYINEYFPISTQL